MILEKLSSTEVLFFILAEPKEKTRDSNSRLTKTKERNIFYTWLPSACNFRHSCPRKWWRPPSPRHETQPLRCCWGNPSWPGLRPGSPGWCGSCPRASDGTKAGRRTFASAASTQTASMDDWAPWHWQQELPTTALLPWCCCYCRCYRHCWQEAQHCRRSTDMTPKRRNKQERSSTATTLHKHYQNTVHGLNPKRSMRWWSQ